MMNLKQLPAILTLSSLIAGCSMPMMPPTVTGPSGVSKSNNQANSKTARAEQLIAAASQAQPIRSAELKLEAAQLLIQDGKKAQATSLLSMINTQVLPPSLQFNIIKLKTQGALSDEDAPQALSYLAYMPALESLSEDERFISDQLYADAYNLSGDALEEAKILIESSNYIQGQEQLRNLHNRIWQALQSVQDANLSAAIQQANNSYFLQGWLELAQAARTLSDITSATNNVDNWVALWQTHPAASTMPDSLMGTTNTEAVMQANNIGVFLPLSGKLAKVGQAIKDGISIAHNASQNQQLSSAPTLSFIDSSTLVDANSIAQIASERGFDLVIGPLEKDKVAQLAELSSLAVPFLALNYADSQRPNLYQYGLSTEDEARDAAMQALKSGHSHALIITPDTSWGLKAADAFDKTFSTQGGTVVARTTFNKDTLTQDISNLLNTDASKARARKLKSITGLNFEFEERRRQDADVILMSARPNDARSIKPILSFYFAGDLPIYATSQVYSGKTNPNQDNDLEGITFGDIPWVLSPPSATHKALANTGSNTGSRFGRFFAMGIDAYRLYPYLQQLRSNPNNRLKGETGQLSVDANNRVLRHLQWATFKNGVPTPVETQALSGAAALAE